MWHRLNLTLRRHTPAIHNGLKKVLHRWQTSQRSPLPVPRLIGDRLAFLHPLFLTYSTYEPQVQSQIKLLLKQKNIFIDIGANFGFHTILASKLVGQNGRVLAFEPSTENLKILDYHYRVNNLKNVSVYSDALGSQVKPAVDFVLVDGGRHSSNSLTIKKDVPYILDSQKQVVQVSMTTIDFICESENIRPDLIKIDVEGAELFVLEGAINTLRQHKPVVIFGLHPFWMPDEHDPEKLTMFLQDLGYTIKTIDGNEIGEFSFGDYIAYPRKQNRV